VFFNFILFYKNIQNSNPQSHYKCIYDLLDTFSRKFQEYCK